MRATLWGTRGSLATPGPETSRYGGNTSCVGVRGREGTVLVLDAGTGIRRLAATLDARVRRIDILLTHLHMDHIQGLGFFAPLYRPDVAVHIWGPASSKLTLRERLMRYLSPPLFPVCLRELPSEITLHEVPCGEVDIGEFRVSSTLVCHPGPTVGYRLPKQVAPCSPIFPTTNRRSVRIRSVAPRAWTSGGARRRCRSADSRQSIRRARVRGPHRVGTQLFAAIVGLRNALRGEAPRPVPSRSKPHRRRSGSAVRRRDRRRQAGL